MKATAAYALLYSLALSHVYYYADTGVLPLYSLFHLSSRLHPIILGTLSLPLIAYIVLRRNSLFRGRYLPFCLLALIGTLTIIIAYYALTLDSHKHVDQTYVFRSAGALLRYSILFVAGYYLKPLLRSPNFRASLIPLYILIVANVLLHTDFGVPAMDFSYLSQRPDRHLRDYIFYADTFALFSLLVTATTLRRPARIALVLISTICLYLLISRAAFYAYLFVATILLFDDHVGWRRYAIPALYLLVCYWLLISPEALQTQSRISAPLSADLSSNISTISRLLTLRRGVDHLLREAWLLGDFRSHYKQFRQPGTYIHNYLSLWSDYGIAPFVAFASLLLTSFLYLPRAQKLGLLAPHEKAATDVYRYMLLFNAILVIGARSHFFPYVFLSFGLLFALRERDLPTPRRVLRTREVLRSPTARRSSSAL